MKLISFRCESDTKIGIMLSESSLADISPLVSSNDIKDLIRSFHRHKDSLLNLKKNNLASYSINEVKLLSPIPLPNSLRDAYSFKQHVETSRANRGLAMIKEFDDFPVYYYSNHNSVKGPGEISIAKELSRKIDYEVEIAVIIGKEGINIKASDAYKYIFGLTIMNDLSSREIQAKEMKLNLGPAKGKDFATSLGPYIVTLDELEEITTLSNDTEEIHFNIPLECRVNDKVLSRDNLSNMHWSFSKIIERISMGTRIYPGDVIGSGTCATGCLLELNSNPNAKIQWLEDADTVEINAGALGVLKNTIKII